MSNADSAISRPQFDNIENIALHIETIEDIDSIPLPSDQGSNCPGFMRTASETAVLMLTSGSTGVSKAVVCIFSGSFTTYQCPWITETFELVLSHKADSEIVQALSHANIISALQGKQQMHNTVWSDVFLNWTSFSHVCIFSEFIRPVFNAPRVVRHWLVSQLLNFSSSSNADFEII